MDKKGDTIALETVIFIVLNLAFFAILLVFVLQSSEGVTVCRTEK